MNPWLLSEFIFHSGSFMEDQHRKSKTAMFSCGCVSKLGTLLIIVSFWPRVPRSRDRPRMAVLVGCGSKFQSWILLNNQPIKKKERNAPLPFLGRLSNPRPFGARTHVASRQSLNLAPDRCRAGAWSIPRAPSCFWGHRKVPATPIYLFFRIACRPSTQKGGITLKIQVSHKIP